MHFEGVIPNLQRRFENTDSEYIKHWLAGYLCETPCETCEGSRLRPEALHVKLRSGRLDASIADVTAMTIDQAVGFFDTVELSEERRQIAEPILREINARLGFLASVGLSYLTLRRRA